MQSVSREIETGCGYGDSYGWDEPALPDIHLQAIIRHKDRTVCFMNVLQIDRDWPGQKIPACCRNNRPVFL